MADTKISDLTAVTTPASTDEFAVNQGGTSKKQTRAQLHALVSGEHLILPQVSEVATPTFEFGSNGTGFFGRVTSAITVAIAGVLRYEIGNNDFRCFTTSSFSLNRGAGSATVAVYRFEGDTNTGIGRHSADNLSLIAGGLEAIRVEDPADLGAGETSLWLYDDDNDTVEQVTVGIADSGGAGFKLLRITN